jgi:hypothetical protein
MGDMMGPTVPLNDRPSMDKEILVEAGVAVKMSDASSGVGEIAYVPADDKHERHLTIRVDFKLVPILGLLYLICFLDR